MRYYTYIILTVCLLLAMACGCSAQSDEAVNTLCDAPIKAAAIIDEGKTTPVAVINESLSVEDNGYLLPPDWIADPAADDGFVKNTLSAPDKSAQLSSVFFEAQLKAQADAKAAAELKAKQEAAAAARLEQQRKKAAQENNASSGSTVAVNSSVNIASLLKSRNYSSNSVTVYQSAANDIPKDTSGLENAIERDGDACSVLAIRLSDGASVGYNVDKQFKCLSTFKAATALYGYKQAVAGKASLDDTMTYRSAYYYSGSGIMKSAKYGTSYTLRTLINYSIIYSDNIAYVMLRDYFSSSGIASMIQSLGCRNYDSASSEWPLISARDSALWWNEIYNFCNTYDEAQTLWNSFLNGAGCFVKQTLNYKYKVAHKSGSGNGYYHDCGIVLCDEPYIYIILTYESGTGNYNQSYMGPIIKQLDKLMNAQ